MQKNIVRYRYVSPLSVLALIVAHCSCVAVAAEAAPNKASGWSGLVGVGAAYQPTYPGSPNQRATPVPMLSVEYRDPVIGTFALDERGLSWTFLDDDAFRAGILLGGDTGRKDHRKSGDLFSTGDDRLQGMGDLDATAEAGAILGYGPVTLIARKAIGDDGHGGLVADLEIGQSIDLSDRLELSFGVGARWADKKYMQSWFGVTNAQAASSRFSAYTPEEGFVHVGALVGLDYRFASAWHAQMNVSRINLIGDAKESPLAEEASSATVFVGIARHFE